MKTIVYIGAPEPSELRRTLSGAAPRVVVIDPLPGLADRLRIQLADGPLESLGVAVSASGANQLYEYGIQNLSSLHRPNTLTRLYPGLKVRAIHPVPTYTPSELPERLKLSKEDENTLYIDAPGEERSMIQQLVDTGAINHFSRLYIVLYNAEMYVDDHAEFDLKSSLKKAGFSVKIDKDSSVLYERLECLFDVNKAQIKELESKLKQASEQLDRAHEQSEKANQDNESIRNSLKAEQEKSARLQSELDDTKNVNQKRKARISDLELSLKSEQESHAASAEELRNNLTSEKDVSAKLRSELEGAMNRLEQQRNSNNELKSKLDKALEEMQEKREAVGRLEGDLKKSRDDQASAQKKAEDLEKKLHSLESQLKAVQTEKSALEKQMKELGPLKQQVSSLEQERSEIKEKLSAEQKALTRAQSIIDDLKQRLKTQTVENDQQVEAEFIKAESQLELIKDILIREKLF